ncbi:hypothetical protein PQX77_010376 [Marasmius sp. AFHP31]|nr:hypothetical protein PQX77_010376 [Marasmius sp. AFHP31]
MSMFHSATHFNITGGTFNIVHGNQNNNDNHYYCPDSQTSLECRAEEEWKETLKREYDRVPLGRIKLLRTLYLLKTHYYVLTLLETPLGYTTEFQEYSHLEAERAVEIASIENPDGTAESPPRLVVKYTGPDAQKLFKEDCDLFSRQRATDVAQLRAFNDSDIPIIIFNEDRKVLTAVCWNSSFASVTDSLTPGGLAYEDARMNKMSLIGGESSSERVLALPYHQWAYHVCNWMYDEAEDGVDYKAMENGEMRFSIERAADEDYQQGFSFKQYKDSPRYCEGEHWLPQAGQIFTHYKIPRREWGFYRFIAEITFILREDEECITQHATCTEEPFKQQRRNNLKELDPPCYLFVLPLPQCPDSTPDIETWLCGKNLYYYSYNPKGGSPITKEECISLGLPLLTSDVNADYEVWDNNAYDFMEEWQKAKGYDYTTADYAKSLGIPDLLARPQEERRFEDLTDLPDVLEADLMDVDSDEVTHTTETHAPSGLSEEVGDDRMDVD